MFFYFIFVSFTDLVNLKRDLMRFIEEVSEGADGVNREGALCYRSHASSISLEDKKMQLWDFYSRLRLIGC